jgi:uncharacterized delta-60 repeat protein
VLLLTALGLALLLATIPDYWDWDLHRLREVIRRDQRLRAQYAGNIQVTAAERRAAEKARRAALDIARVKGRVTGSIQGLFDLFVTDAVQQPDGRIVVVGLHNDYGLGLARLNVDGSLDEEFVRRANWETAGELTGSPEQVALAPDGTILVAGRFVVEGRPRVLVRFRSDGTLDTPFLSATADLPPDAEYHRRPRVAIQPDGAIVFVEFGHENRPPVLLRSDGAVDRGWDPAARGVSWEQPFVGADRKLVPRPPGLPEITPPFRVGVVSMGPGNTDSILRTEGGAGFAVGMAYLGVQPDGRTLLVRQRVLDLEGPPPPLPPGGPFVFIGDEPEPWESHLFRVNGDGTSGPLTLDAPLCGGPSRVFHVWAVAFQGDGGAVLAGDLPLEGAGGACEHYSIWRVTPSGALDPQFRKTSRRELVRGSDPTMMHKILVLEDGRIVIGGAFTSVQGQPRKHLARLRPDGSVE